MSGILINLALNEEDRINDVVDAKKTAIITNDRTDFFIYFI